MFQKDVQHVECGFAHSVGPPERRVFYVYLEPDLAMALTYLGLKLLFRCRPSSGKRSANPEVQRARRVDLEIHLQASRLVIKNRFVAKP